ncbi:MAG: ribonuclease P protein component [Muribaculaceae bacterium]|nr:ribonuclease P protein component [Muribaculaceae bacterium]
MKGLRLYKTEKLCSRTAVSLLFEQGHSSIAFPLRAVYRLHEPGKESPAQFLITIPKKKIRHAVDRVLLRRRTREAYRLWRRSLLYPTLLQTGLGADIAFIYLDKEPSDYVLIEKRMKQLLTRIAQAAEAHNNSPQP